MEPQAAIQHRSNVVVKLSREEGQQPTLQLNHDELQLILNEIPDTYKLHAISICGPPNPGKSCILTLLVNLLTKMESGSENPWEGLWGTQGEMENGCTRDNDKGSFQMWPHPFILPQGIAVILIATPCLSSPALSKHESSLIAGFSILSSSTVVYNMLGQITEEGLQSFGTFSEFATLCSTEKRGKAVFLLNDVHPGTNESSIQDGKFQITGEMCQEAQARRRNIEDAFTRLSSFLVAPPESQGFDGILNIQNDFLESLKEATNSILELNEKECLMANGEPMRVKDFADLLSRNVETLNSQYFPKPVSLCQGSQEAKLVALKETSVKEATGNFNTFLAENFQPFAESKQKCGELGKIAIATFRSATNGICPTIAQKHQGVLAVELKTAFPLALEAHEANKRKFVKEQVSAFVSYTTSNLIELLNGKDQIYLPEQLHGILRQHWDDGLIGVQRVMQTYKDKEDMCAVGCRLYSEEMEALCNSQVHGNDSKFDQLKETILKSIETLKGEYGDTLDLLIELGDKKNFTKDKLRKADSHCRSKVKKNFPRNAAFANPELKTYFLRLLDDQLDACFEELVQKLEEDLREMEKEATTEFTDVWNKYTTNLKERMEQQPLTDSQISTLSDFWVWKCSDNLEDLGFPEYKKKLRREAQSHVATLIEAREEKRLESKNSFDTALDGLVAEYQDRMQKALVSIINEEELADTQIQISEELIQAFLPENTHYQSAEDVSHAVRLRFQQCRWEFESAMLGNQSQYIEEVRCNLVNTLTALEDLVAGIVPLPDWDAFKFASSLAQAKEAIMQPFQGMHKRLPRRQLEKLSGELELMMDKKREEYQLQLRSRLTYLSELFERAGRLMLQEVERMLSAPNSIPNEGPGIKEHCRKLALDSVMRDILHLGLQEEKEVHLITEIDRHMETVFLQASQNFQEKMENKRQAITDLKASILSKYDNTICLDGKSDREIAQTHQIVCSELLAEFLENLIQLGVTEPNFVKETKHELASEFETRHQGNLELYMELCNDNDMKTKYSISEVARTFRVHVSNIVTHRPYISHEEFEQILGSERSQALLTMQNIEVPANRGTVYTDFMKLELNQACESLREVYEQKLTRTKADIKSRLTGDTMNQIKERLLGENEISDTVSSIKQEILEVLGLSFIFLFGGLLVQEGGGRLSVLEG